MMEELIKVMGKDMIRHLDEDEPDVSKIVAEGLGHNIEIVSFKTRRELEAYVKGFDAGLGYSDGWCVCDDEDEFERLEDLYERVCDEANGRYGG
jgi:hypothetical protein